MACSIQAYASQYMIVRQYAFSFIFHISRWSQFDLHTYTVPRIFICLRLINLILSGFRAYYPYTCTYVRRNYLYRGRFRLLSCILHYVTSIFVFSLTSHVLIPVFSLRMHLFRPYLLFTYIFTLFWINFISFWQLFNIFFRLMPWEEVVSPRMV